MDIAIRNASVPIGVAAGLIPAIVAVPFGVYEFFTLDTMWTRKNKRVELLQGQKTGSTKADSNQR